MNILRVSTFRICLCCLSVAFVNCLLGQEERARVDIGSSVKDPFNLEIIGTSEGGRAEWLGNNWQQIMSHFPATAEWREGFVTFKPKKTGRVSISAAGPWVMVDPATKLMKAVMIDFDDFGVSGATLENGGFEETTSTGDLLHWYALNIPSPNVTGPADNRARLMGGDAAEGTSFIRVWHNSRFGQTVEVVEDTPVTVKFRYRLSK